MSKALAEAARNAVALAKPRRGERVLVITDRHCIKIGQALFDAACGKNDAAMIVIEPTGEHGAEPPKSVAKAMLGSDVIFAPTKFSITHTSASRNAKKNGATVATLPGITEGTFIRGMRVDYKKVAVETKKLGKMLRKAGKVRIVAEGTDITLDVKGCKKADDDGSLRRGSINNLPSGEATVAPNAAYGFFTAIDPHFTGKKVKFTFNGRKLSEVSDKRLKKRLWAAKNARHIAELGIGTNPGARLSGSVLEDEKVKGTCHIAVGDSKGLGGKVSAGLHWDFIINKPTMWFGRKLVMKNGRLAA